MPTTAELLSIALKHHRAGRLQEGEQLYRQILSVEANNAEAWHFLGVLMQEKGNTTSALECLERALSLRPEFADAFYSLGFVMTAQGRVSEAIAAYRQAVQLKPDFADAYNNLGIALLGQGDFDQAIASYRRAADIQPDFAEAHYNLGQALHQQNKYSEAIECYRQALLINPNYIEALNNLGEALAKIGALRESLACCRRALELRPNYADALNNLGNALLELRELDEAERSYQAALKLDPNDASTHVNHSLLLLLKGDFEHGWPEYEWRWKTGQFQRREFAQPEWNGEPLEGKTILLHAEQGFGDTIQFIRYAPLIKERGAKVIAACQRPLLTLLSGYPSIDHLIALSDAPPAFDFHAPLLNLPKIFATTVETIPAAVPYLFADQRLIDEWRANLSKVPGFRIGINWHGREGNPASRRRDIPLECFAPLIDVPGTRVISLQKGAGRQELAALRDRLPIIDLGDDVDTAHGAFMDTAAVIMNLDVVITSDTSIAHLAGALGKPVWLALQFAAEWRWLLDRFDSPWYPTVRLFRQKSPGDWPGVFREIRSALRDKLASHPQPVS